MPKESRSTPTSMRHKPILFLPQRGRAREGRRHQAGDLVQDRRSARRDNRQPVTEDNTPRVRFEAERPVYQGFAGEASRQLRGRQRTAQRQTDVSTASRRPERTEVPEWNVPGARREGQATGLRHQGRFRHIVVRGVRERLGPRLQGHRNSWTALARSAVGRRDRQECRRAVSKTDGTGRPAPSEHGDRRDPNKIERGTAEIEVVASATPPPTIKEVTFIVGTTKVTDADFDKAEQEGKTIKGVSPDNGRSWRAKIKVPADVAKKLRHHRALQTGRRAHGALHHRC